MINNNNFFVNDENIINLVKKDFKIKNNKIKLINKKFHKKKTLLLFYAPWCSHCKEMIPIWEEVADLFKNIIMIGAINCDDIYNDNDSLKISFGIKYYPVVKYIDESGVIEDVDQLLNKNDILYFLYKKT